MELQRHLLVAFKDYYGICDLTDFKLCDDDKIIPSYHNVLYDEVYWHKRGLTTPPLPPSSNVCTTIDSRKTLNTKREDKEKELRPA